MQPSVPGSGAVRGNDPRMKQEEDLTPSEVSSYFLVPGLFISNRWLLSELKWQNFITRSY